MQPITVTQFKIVNMFLSKYFTGCLLIAGMMMSSCDKKDSFDVTGDPEVKFFMNNESSGDLPGNAISYNITNYPDVAGNGWLTLSATVPANIKIPVFATKPVSDDVTIGAEVDNSLVAQY